MFASPGTWADTGTWRGQACEAGLTLVGGRVAGKAGWLAVSGVARAGLRWGLNRRAEGARLSPGVWLGQLSGGPVVPEVGTLWGQVWREGIRPDLGC